jgi:uncharacterized protein YjaZ
VEFKIIDTASFYRRLLATDDLAEREHLYRQELLEPFAGMFRIFGGGDALSMAKMWGLYTPEDFSNGARPKIESLLAALAAHDAWGKAAEALERGRQAFAPFADRLRLETVTFALVLADLSRANPIDRGYTGFGGIPGYVLAVYGDANDYTLPRLGGACVHELNHNLRFSVFPFNPMQVTVGEYSIAEGLAEAFAAELFGEEVIGYYVTDINEEELATARQVIGSALEVTGFNEVRSYIFGDTISAHMGRAKAGVPDFAGYAIGYRVVRQYLARTGKTVAEATFVPAQEIITESGFFA